MKRYEILEHTADVGLIAFGRDLDEAFENAAYGMFDIITDVEKLNALGEYRVVLEAQDLEQLLVDWLSELLFIHTVKRVMFSEFKVDMKKVGSTGWKLSGRALGEDFQKDKHPYHVEVKAVTHHMLEVKEESEVNRIQVLFDI